MVWKGPLCLKLVLTVFWDGYLKLVPDNGLQPTVFFFSKCGPQNKRISITWGNENSLLNQKLWGEL